MLHLKSLKLTNFRNHTDLNLDFKTINIIFGPNASGKTSILEAIDMLSGSNSFKAAKNKDLVGWGSEYLKIEGVLSNKTLLGIFIEANKKFSNTTYQVNHSSRSKKRFSENIKTVLFSHKDLNVLEGSPSQRRGFLNKHLCYDYQYCQAINQCNKVIRNRNKLLEQIREGVQKRTTLPYWNMKLLQQAEIIEKKRGNYFNFLSQSLPKVTAAFDNLFPLNNIEIEYYKKRIDHETLKSLENREIAAGQTLRGPHRADFSILVDGKDQGIFGSRGQQRSLIIAIKKAEADYIHQETGVEPLILLDDIFSELDKNAVQAVKTIIENKQTFVTDTSSTIFDNRSKNMFPAHQVALFELFLHTR